MQATPQWKMFDSPQDTGGTGVYVLPGPPAHHRQVPSCASVVSDCSFYSAEDNLPALDLADNGVTAERLPYAERSRHRHTRSRSLESFTSQKSGALLGGWGMDEGAGIAISAREEYSCASGMSLMGGPGHGQVNGSWQQRPAVPPLPLHRLSKFKATISVKISQEGAPGYKPEPQQVAVGTPAVIGGVPKPMGSTGSQKLPRCSTGKPPLKKTHSRFRNLACLSAYPIEEETPRLESTQSTEGKKSKSKKLHASRSLPARLTAVWGHAREQKTGPDGSAVKPRRRTLLNLVSMTRKHTRKAAARDTNAGSLESASSLQIDVGFQVEEENGKYSVGNLCPSIPGTDTRQFTSRGPNVSWIDEQFYDCDETWEKLLAPLTPHLGLDPENIAATNILDGKPEASVLEKPQAVVPAKPQRPHRVNASVEDVCPVYLPPDATDKTNKSQLGYISSRKVVLPGLSTVPRKDEMGPGVKTLSELKSELNGTWERVAELSDDVGVVCDVMELPWIFKRALCLSSQTEVDVADERVAVKPRIFGVSIPNTATPWTRDGVLVARRDRRKGPSRISLVRTTFGFRQYNCWADPCAGLSIVEIGASEDGMLVMSTFIKRRTGASCKVRTVFKKV